MSDEKPDDRPMAEGLIPRSEVEALLVLSSGILRQCAAAFEVFEPTDFPHPPMRAFLAHTAHGLDRITRAVLSPQRSVGISDTGLTTAEQRESVDRIAQHNSSAMDELTKKSHD